MITHSTSSPSSSIYKKPQSYQIIFEQDAIFSGFEYFNYVSETSLENPENIIWHIKEGEAILKGQSCVEIFQETKNLQEVIKIISYLSGASTLARCYAEAFNPPSVVGSPLKDSPLFEWEIKSLLMGGVDAKPSLPEKICYCEKDLNLQDPVIALSSEIPKDELKKLLKKIPSHKVKGLYGPILPQNLEKLNELPINVIWPEILHGVFPCVRIKIHGNK